MGGGGHARYRPADGSQIMFLCFAIAGPNNYAFFFPAASGSTIFPSVALTLSHSVLGTPFREPSRVSLTVPFFSASFHSTHSGWFSCQRVPMMTSHVGVRKPRLK